MHIVFKSQKTGQYMVRHRNVAGHWYELVWSPDLNEASVHSEEWFYQKPYYQSEMDRWEEKTGEKILPVQVQVVLKKEE